MTKEEEIKDLEAKYKKLRALAIKLANEMDAVVDRYKELTGKDDGSGQ